MHTQLPYSSHSIQLAQAGSVHRDLEPAVCAALGAPSPSETVETTSLSLLITTNRFFIASFKHVY